MKRTVSVAATDVDVGSRRSVGQPGSPSAPHGGGSTDNPAGKAPFRVDLEDIQFRILDLPIPAADLSNPQAGAITGSRHAPTCPPAPRRTLGADYTVENGRYRFKRVYGGLNFNLPFPEEHRGRITQANDWGVVPFSIDRKDLRRRHSISET